MTYLGFGVVRQRSAADVTVENSMTSQSWLVPTDNANGHRGAMLREHSIGIVVAVWCDSDGKLSLKAD